MRLVRAWSVGLLPALVVGFSAGLRAWEGGFTEGWEGFDLGIGAGRRPALPVKAPVQWLKVPQMGRALAVISASASFMAFCEALDDRWVFREATIGGSRKGPSIEVEEESSLFGRRGRVGGVSSRRYGCLGGGLWRL